MIIHTYIHICKLTYTHIHTNTGTMPGPNMPASNGYYDAHYGARHAGAPYYYDQHGMVTYAPPAPMEPQA